MLWYTTKLSFSCVRLARSLLRLHLVDLYKLFTSENYYTLRRNQKQRLPDARIADIKSYETHILPVVGGGDAFIVQHPGRIRRRLTRWTTCLWLGQRWLQASNGTTHKTHFVFRWRSKMKNIIIIKVLCYC